MSAFEPKPAVRQNIPLLVLLAGGTGSGKTESSLRLATGLANGGRICVIDTENGRALHKADDYTFDHVPLEEPFSPERYAEALKAIDGLGYAVVIVDSGSHEYDGIGGVLESQEAEFQRMGGKESARMASWIAPKSRHRKYVQQLLRMRAHVILNHRAADKVEVVKEDGKTVVRPKHTLTGTDGWVPICEARLPFEATISLLFTADRPGVPRPVKLERRHQALVPLDRQVDESVGRALAEWAAGGNVAPVVRPAAPEPGEELLEEARALADLLLAYGRERGNEEAVAAAVDANRVKHAADLSAHVGWLKSQLERVSGGVAA